MVTCCTAARAPHASGGAFLIWQVVQCLLASRETMESPSEYYAPFRLLGFDFMLDDDLRVWLCEVRALMRAPRSAAVKTAGCARARAPPTRRSGPRPGR